MASTAAEKPSTVKDLRAALDSAGIDYDAKAKKDALEKLYDQHIGADSAPTDSSSGASVGEGPTDLAPEQEPTQDICDGPVLLKGLTHDNVYLPAGSPVPTNLAESDLARLQRLGLISGGESPAKPGFDVFEGSDGEFYWHLRAENGEIVAQGEGYSNRQAADRGVEAVKAAVAAS